MFRAHFRESTSIKVIVDTLKDLSGDVNFELSGGGIFIQAMDAAHIALCQIDLNKDIFNHYVCDEQATIGININSLSKVLHCSTGNDSIILSIDDDHCGDHLNITIRNDKKQKYQFNMNLIDLEYSKINVGEQKYSVEIKMSGPGFQKICKDLLGFGEVCNITYNAQEGLVFSTSGDLGKLKIDYGGETESGDSDADVEFSEEEDLEQQVKDLDIGSEESDEEVSEASDDDDAVDSDFYIKKRKDISIDLSLKYLNMFCRPASLTSFIYISLSEDRPARFYFEDPKFGTMTFHLAPKQD